MKSNFMAIVLAIALFGGLFYYFFYAKTPAGSVIPTETTSGTTEAAPSTATNYDECIAEGNVPLPEDPDKCLTKDGHLFIQGVVEE